MRSVLAASPLSLGAPVLRLRESSAALRYAMENPSNARSKALRPGWDSGVCWNIPRRERLKATPVHRPVDNLGNFIS
jgi:hypothetical protein